MTLSSLRNKFFVLLLSKRRYAQKSIKDRRFVGLILIQMWMVYDFYTKLFLSSWGSISVLIEDQISSIIRCQLMSKYTLLCLNDNSFIQCFVKIQ